MARCANCGAELAEAAGFCHLCGSAASVPTADRAVAELREQLAELKKTVSEHAGLIDQHAEIINELGTDVAGVESLLDSSSVYHSSFWARAWAIYGHVLVPGLIIGVAVYVFLFAALGLRLAGR